MTAKPALYDDEDLVRWYRLLDPAEDHFEEAVTFQAAFERAISGRAESLLELGAGAGHNACHLKRHFKCTLTDISEPMVGLSRELNPECEHLVGDMRTMRLGRTFDAVLAHDGIVYMTTEHELRAAIETAFVHTRSGGAALFTPDCVSETFAEHAQLHEGNDDRRALRCLEWNWDPNPNDTSYCAEYAFLLREGGAVRAVHDRHFAGMFPRATWVRLFSDVGYEVDTVRRPLGDGQTDEVFLCRRP
jgi:SAM-dependent methyltransferase